MWILMTLVVTLIIICILVLVLIFVKPSEKMPDTLSKNLKDFLILADTKYILTFEKTDIRYFAPYCSARLAETIEDTFCGDAFELFSSRAYRRVEWDYLGLDGSFYVVQRNEFFNNIKLRGVTVKLGEDSVEYWYILPDKKMRYQIVEII